MAAHNDRVLLPVTAVIYRNGQEKAAMRWSFDAAIGQESPQPTVQEAEYAAIAKVIEKETELIGWLSY